jgi:hypothetical protein
MARREPGWRAHAALRQRLWLLDDRNRGELDATCTAQGVGAAFGLRWARARTDLPSTRRQPTTALRPAALGSPDDANSEMGHPQLMSYGDFELGQRLELARPRASRLAGSMRH